MMDLGPPPSMAVYIETSSGRERHQICLSNFYASIDLEMFDSEADLIPKKLETSPAPFVRIKNAQPVAPICPNI